jgi:predicted secreted hydrolase
MTNMSRTRKGTVLLSILGAALLVLSAIMINLTPGQSSMPVVQQVTPVDKTSTGADNTPQAGPQKMAYPYEADPFLFPQDEGAHPEFTEEWWYVNAHVMDQNGNLYEIMVCFFKHGIVTASVLDVSKGHYTNTTQTFTDIKMSIGHLDVRFGTNEIYQIVGKPFTYRLNYDGPKFQMSLELTSTQKPLIVNGNGIVPMGQGASYYYSLTNMTATGTLTVLSREHQVSGAAWMDRQWGYWDPRASWDWFSVQLDNGMQLVLYKVFGSDATSQVFLYMSIIDAKGHTSDINQSGEKIRIVLDYNGYWRSPDTRQVYSSGWNITVPELGLKLMISPIKVEQEVLYYPAGSSGLAVKPFWEGGCAVLGSYQGARVSGRAFVETSFDYQHIRGDLQLQIKQSKMEGDHLELMIKVEDKGGYSLDNVEIFVIAGSPYDGGRVLTMDHISARDNSTYFKEELPNPGEAPIFITIDPNNRIAELDEGNNIVMAFAP